MTAPINNPEQSPNLPNPQHPGNIYDVFAKNIFGMVFVFADFLWNYAEPKFVQSIDLANISPSPTHFIGEKGVEQITDLAFFCPIKGGSGLKTVVLLEHAGGSLDDLPVRLYSFAGAIWRAEIKEGKKILSAIYFLVIRTGMKPYHRPYPQFTDRLPKDANGQPIGYAPKVPYDVVDLPAFDMADLHGEAVTRIGMGILKKMTEGHEDEFAEAMLPIAEITDDKLKVIVTKDVLDLVAKVFAARGKRLEIEAVYDALTPIFHERTEDMTTTIFDEARMEGEVKGRIEGKQDVVLAALRKRFTIVPKNIESSIRQMTDPITLDSLVFDVFESRTLDEFSKALR
ncbi:MAG: Rpn family recombination-promoting nuclease/putative transposase [Planctomycetaceae bacterium]|jgi:hypothetical protein|nr:Rpn family recombination-promoting nuclease/putative transposase [Planctomycetaceae bacterium]